MFDTPSRQSASRWPRDALSGVAGREAGEWGPENGLAVRWRTPKRTARRVVFPAQDGVNRAVLDEKCTGMFLVCTYRARKLAVS